MTKPNTFNSRGWAYGSLAIGLICSVLMAWGLLIANENRVRAAVEQEANRLADAVLARLHLYQYGLRGARGAVLTAGEHGLNRDLFRRYSLTRDIDHEFPGARGFGFIRRVPAEKETAFLASARVDGQPDFAIRQLSPNTQERYVIQYIEPVDRNKQAIGLDIASESNRREAAKAALDSGEVRLTGPITLVQVTGKPQQSFLILMPIYRHGVTPPQAAERDSEAFGWSYAPLLMSEVLTGLNIDGNTVHIELRDVTADNQAVSFYSSENESGHAKTLLTQQVERDVFGRRWQMALSVYPLFIERLHQPSPLLVLLIGSLMSLLLATLVSMTRVNLQRRNVIAQERARLSAIVESSDDAIIGKTLDGTITSWNKGAERLFGYDEKVAVGNRVENLIVPTSMRDEEASILAKIARGERVASFDTKRKHLDGHLMDVAITVSPILGPNGSVVGASKTVRDITAQKLAEAHILELNCNLEFQVAERTQELNQLNILLGTVLQSASEVAIIATDTEGTIKVFNRGAERMLGYEAAEMIGKTPMLLHLPDELAKRSQELSQEYSQPISGFRIFVHKSELEGSETREWCYIRKDDSRLTVTLVVTAMRNETGTITGYLGIAVDITNRLIIERELMATRDQLMMAAEVAQLGIWTWTLPSNALQWNDRMFELYEQPLTLRDNGLNYNHWLTRVHADDVDATVASLNAAVQGNSIYDPIFRLTLPSGQVRFIQAGGYVERDVNGNALRVTGINLDITSEKELQESLRYAKEQADAANAAKSSFLANMSHEIRTPMNAVLGMLHLAQQSGLNRRQRDYIDKASSAATSLLGLLNDILDYSKIEAGKLLLDTHPFELEPLMQDLAVVLSGNQRSQSVEMMFDLDSDLPCTLIGDRLRLQQILINLAGNAIKFTAHGQVVVSVRQMERLHNKVRIRFAVIDTGIGISEQQQQRIFEGFTQAEASTSRRFGGTGLGLYICKRLVALMGCELRLESKPGVGSCFWFDLELEVASVQPLRDECPNIHRQLELLVVDDNSVSGNLLVQAIKELGWQGTYVKGGLEALERIQTASMQNKKYDVILMDWRMSDMDGVQAAHLIRQIEHGVAPPIIMVTAFGREVIADEQDKPETPFVDFLTKPVTPKQLANAVVNALTGCSNLTADSQASTPHRLAGLKLLVVEDNALNRQVAAELLASEGGTVMLAEGGLEGVRKVIEATEPFDAILMDMQMPDIDGLEATRRIRNDGRFSMLPILAMTANATQADRQACLDAGMNDHISKPINKEHLISSLLIHLAAGRADSVLQTLQPVNIHQIVEHRGGIVGRFGGNLRLIEHVLASFGPEMEKHLGALEKQIKAKDRTAAASTLHSIKGSAGTMGASALAKRAADHEADLLNCSITGLESALGRVRIDELYQLLSVSLDTLRGLFGSTKSVTSANAGNTSISEFKEHLRTVLNLLESGDMDALDHIDSLLLQRNKHNAQHVDQLAEKIQALDFNSALHLGRKIYKEL